MASLDKNLGKKFEKDIQRRFKKAGVAIPLDGSDTSAAREYRQRVKAAGFDVSQGDALKTVRKARKSVK